MIGIIGSGAMGKSIAIEFAKSGRKVLIYSAQRHLSDEKLKEELSNVIVRSKIEDAEYVFNLIKIAHYEEEFSNCEIIIEALSEDLDLKRNILSKIAVHLKENTLFCSNTSSLSLEEIFHGIFKLENVIGLHFFNPPSVMRLVEIAILPITSQQTIENAKSLMINIGKDPVIVKNSPGFIVNKLLIPYINEAVKILESGIAKMEDIDKAMMLGANHPIGPFRLADLIGIDVVNAILNTFIEKGTDIVIATTLIEMLQNNKLGRKTKIGFYDYTVRK
jgi:3-hydroxybutyryl-CoA dehydrogenase